MLRTFAANLHILFKIVMCKHLKIAFLLLSSILFIASCSKTKTYADYLKEERENIKRYINNNAIEVQNARPEGTGEWKTEDGRDLYFQTATGLYYHQILLGEGRIPKVGNEVQVRYVGKELSGAVIYDCTDRYSPNPQSFYLVTSPSGQRFGVGFQEAVKYLQVGGRCRIILPFNIGNGTNLTLEEISRSDAMNYTPMIYEIELISLD